MTAPFYEIVGTWRRRDGQEMRFDGMTGDIVARYFGNEDLVWFAPCIWPAGQRLLVPRANLRRVARAGGEAAG